MSDPKITRLVNELILLMASINLSKKQGSGKHYTINISGKAKPMVETQEKTNVNGITRTVNFSITINPPAQQNPAAAAPAPAVETPQAKAQPANLNVAV